MKAVNIAQLKDNLSSYLKQVRNGEEMIVCDRNVPVARLVPWIADEEDEVQALALQGVLRVGEGPISEAFWTMRAPKVSRQALRAATDAERDED
jgi:prevent-host-death family protein